MRLNGAPYDNAELKRIAGYVMQDDLLNGYLTVEETLIYTAKLRLPRAFTQEQRKERVEDVINDLGLAHVRKAIIGTQLKLGISGSERKRLCVSMQLLNRPQLLFLDEPTTGLDSVTALDLLHTLHALAHGKSQEKAVTIVCSIHQPQAKIFNLFDSLTLLKAGDIIYQGPRNQVMVTISGSFNRASLRLLSLGRVSSGWISMPIVHQSSRSFTRCHHTIQTRCNQHGT
jgi:ATP-binding cassette subfamily G (WHITE) protein 2